MQRVVATVTWERIKAADFFTTHQPVIDLVYLLHKHLDRTQAFDHIFGMAHLFYPEALARFVAAKSMRRVRDASLLLWVGKRTCRYPARSWRRSGWEARYCRKRAARNSVRQRWHHANIRSRWYPASGGRGRYRPRRSVSPKLGHRRSPGGAGIAKGQCARVFPVIGKCGRKSSLLCMGTRKDYNHEPKYDM